MTNPSRFKLGASAFALTAGVALAASANAQTPPSTGATEPAMTNATGPDTPATQAPPANAAPSLTAASQPNVIEDEIVVTGTSIRGVQPVGANLISVGPKEIAATGAQTLTQILATVPALSSMGNAGQGEVKGSYYQPQIHQLGGSASSSTLVLIDGHRTSPGGTNHTNTDPGIVPINMIERVEVLPEGASSTYGSDAVAGVVNFITRTKFDGVQVGGQYTYADGTRGWQASALAGKTWDAASVILAYSHTSQSSLDATQRPYTNPNQTSRGGTNFNNFNCGPATLQPGGSGPIFLSATSGTSVANSAANSPCSSWAYTTLLPREQRDNVMAKGRIELSDKLTLSGDVVYGVRRTTSAISRGTLTATAFATGTQANPFYITPAGYTGTATRETVRYDFDDLLGRGAKERTGSDSFYADGNLNYKVGSNFEVNLLVLAAHDDSYDRTNGVANQSVATLALNGTTNTAGSLTQPSIPNTTGIITQLPLTTANALDVWNGGSTNRTSSAVRSLLLDNATLLRQVFAVRQARLSTDGKLFALPAGDVGVAIGAEYLRTHLDELQVQSNNTGPASAGSNNIQLGFTRVVKSAFGEIRIPIISADMDIPFVETVNLNLSGRYDHYNDFGTTTNPKVAVDWTIGHGFKLRGNWSTSFVAPPLDIVGDQYGTYVNSRYTTFTNNVAVPVSLYPTLPQMGIAGCTATSVTCNISSLQGLRVNTGDHNAGPQKGRGYSFGLDFHPDFFSGLSGQVTFWHERLRGAVTGPQIGFVVNTASLAHLLTFYPGGATTAQINAATAHVPAGGALPSRTDYILEVINSNYLNLNVSGIDASVTYTLHTGGAGTFVIGDAITYFTKFDQSYGTDGVSYSVLNTTGANGVFPSVKLQMRANLGWQLGGFNANLFMNYTGHYKNWSSSAVTPVTLNAQNNPDGGGDPVRANTTFDANLAYTFSGGFLDGQVISLNVRNMFNRKAPFYNASNGYDGYVANVLGRQISVGAQIKF
ncbi:TonB-dependent receptor domain-containing protein [Sphingomonas crusticola]|uniref:TonB-dependent receptor domain-containing protein n=1 Tax=Sphingomonas crusticola TaxID=1697973 RepID=UPI000E22637B|nr:TonB-dependent receptor [Sphingomonas crusticola]